MNSDDFKPGDLAWVSVKSEDAPSGVPVRNGIATILIVRHHKGWAAAADLDWFWADRVVRQSEILTDFRPATILGPDERAVPKGGVWLDPEDAKALERKLVQAGVSLSAISSLLDRIRAALHALAAEQSAPPVPPEPERDALVRDREGDVWTPEDNGTWSCEGQQAYGAEWADVCRHGPLTIYRPDTAPTDGGAR